MEFLVKLIKVHDTRNQEARDNIQANCTHVANDYWLFEGDEIVLGGLRFTVIDEVPIESYGSLTGKELKRMVSNYYNVTIEEGKQ
jgi:hypothetical protein